MESEFAKRNARLLRFLAYCLFGAAIGVAWSRFQSGHGGSPPIHDWREFLHGRAHAGFPPGIMVSIVLLCVFSVYWEAAARNSSETKSKESARRGQST